MARILIVLMVMLQFTMSFAHDTLISTAIPYSSGIVHLNVDQDTATFSNGLKIFSLVFEYPYQIPEEKRWDGGIACSCTSGDVVYKSDPSMVTKWRRLILNTLQGSIALIGRKRLEILILSGDQQSTLLWLNSR